MLPWWIWNEENKPPPAIATVPQKLGLDPDSVPGENHVQTLWGLNAVGGSW